MMRLYEPEGYLKVILLFALISVYNVCEPEGHLQVISWFIDIDT